MRAPSVLSIYRDLLVRLISVYLFAASSLVAAGIIAFSLWKLLPYEMFRGDTPRDQFLVWEGATWLIGLCFVFFGAAAAFDSLDLYSTRLPGLDEAHTFSGEGRHRRLTFRPASWWVASTGALLVLIAAVARSRLAS